MAKTSSLSFTELDNKLTKIAPLGSVVTKNSFSKIDEWINTGNYMLNAQISGSIFGGVPNTRSFCLAGDSGTGKTFLTLNICREAQAMGYDIIYCDSESAVYESDFVKFGLDPERVRYQPVSTVQEFTVFVNNLVQMLTDQRASGGTIPKVFLVLDSLGNLASTKEKEDAISGKGVRDMTKQQVIRSLFRTVTVDLTANKIPFIITNHTYQGIGLFAKKEISGGGGIAFNPSIILMLGKSQLKGEDTTTSKKAEMGSTGIVVTSRPRKNRFARPIPIRFHISFFKGMNKYTGLEQYINWETCGIEKGDMNDQKWFDKLSKDKQKDFDLEKNSWIEKKSKDGVVEEIRWYFVPRATVRSIVVRHLNERLPAKELFTAKVLTDDILKHVDNTVIKPLFMLPEIGSLDDLADIEDLEDMEDDIFSVVDND